MKLYDLGFILGRFQMLHNGHVAMIKHALELCNRVVIFIGSSNADESSKNPFSYYVREQMIESAFPVEYKGGIIVVKPLPDIGVGDNTTWGKYVLGVFESQFNKLPDLYITGCEKERPSWFNQSMAPKMDELRLSKTNISISASLCRELVLTDNREAWEKCVPYGIHSEYEFYKDIIQDIYKKENTKEGGLDE